MLKTHDTLAVADEIRSGDLGRATPSSSSRADRVIEKYRRVRDFSTRLCVGMQPEDFVVQSMPDVSPTKWHLAHTSWFFETFVVKVWMSSYRPAIPQYAYLFNSYYNAAGDMHRRDLRGLISRPTVAETYRYRASIDDCVVKLIEGADDNLLTDLEPVLTLGLHHEQQHQELLLTDIKHVFAQNPLYPVFEANEPASSATTAPQHFTEFDEAMVSIGYDGSGFSYDNEGPRHRAFIPAFSLSSRPVTNGEYLAFMEAGGYARSEFWLSLGWATANEQRWEAPLYWIKREGAWWNFTLSGLRRVDESEPVTHISYFEAEAYANWDGARLPTEFEWERAATVCAVEGNFVETQRFHPAAFPTKAGVPPGESQNGSARVSLSPYASGLQQMFGDVWEWTRSAYLPYPGYRAAPGALGEYNGKFMCNQMVLRGGSCATSREHIRHTYRNFFPPDKRWQFSGLRLARDQA